MNIVHIVQVDIKPGFLSLKFRLTLRYCVGTINLWIPTSGHNHNKIEKKNFKLNTLAQIVHFLLHWVLMH